MKRMDEVHCLLEYGIQKGLIEEADRWYAANALLDILKLQGLENSSARLNAEESIQEILHRVRSYAVNTRLVENDSDEILDIFDTRIMGALMDRPASFQKKFFQRYRNNPKEATDFFYQQAIDSNYIRAHRIAKDIRWSHGTPYGRLDMTINLSKPEKDPRNITLQDASSTENYPQCMICKENEGYAGRIGHPARQNLRVIPLELAGESWFMQYSPYVYYNEHCIVFHEEHIPMKITDVTMKRLLDFVHQFPHYVIGSNADLPIVGGSILSHDHFQGGRYDFPMAGAKERDLLELDGLTVGRLYWPMSVLRLKSASRERLIAAASTILERWKGYSDKAVGLLSHTGDIEHNTITPIARHRNGGYEMDLILRNNRTDEAHPFGIFHSHQRYHHIKWENIGLIECMGLAVLPGRLKREMTRVKKYLTDGQIKEIREDEVLQKHADFAQRIYEKHSKLQVSSLDTVIEQEIGEVFKNVLENCGVFKEDEEGQRAFKRCCEVMYEGI